MKPIKVVYNACYGGYSLSRKAMERLAQLGVEWAYDDDGFPFHELKETLARHDPRLVQVVEELGEKAGGAYANLRVHVLEGNQYRIDEYDGFETVQEPKDISWIRVES